LKKLYNYEFSKEGSEVSTISFETAPFIIYCQKKIIDKGTYNDYE